MGTEGSRWSREFVIETISLLLSGGLGELDKSIGGVRLRALERKSHSTGPDELKGSTCYRNLLNRQGFPHGAHTHLREASESAGHSEEDSVVVHLSHAEVLKEDSRVGVHVRPRVLGLKKTISYLEFAQIFNCSKLPYLALLEEDVGSDLVEGGHEAEEVVLGQVLEGELALAPAHHSLSSVSSIHFNRNRKRAHS